MQKEALDVRFSTLFLRLPRPGPGAASLACTLTLDRASNATSIDDAAIFFRIVLNPCGRRGKLAPGGRLNDTIVVKPEGARTGCALIERENAGQGYSCVCRCFP